MAAWNMYGGVIEQDRADAMLFVVATHAAELKNRLGGSKAARHLTCRPPTLQRVPTGCVRFKSEDSRRFPLLQSLFFHFLLNLPWFVSFSFLVLFYYYC